mmetsp:Transcript_19578/g.58342  ORF Transcript_19578/g.58342 Transcript_19578/m.58342 type:complete len:207 (+) Transcript_19578:891-1511(+)
MYFLSSIVLPSYSPVDRISTPTSPNLAFTRASTAGVHACGLMKTKADCGVGSDAHATVSFIILSGPGPAAGNGPKLPTHAMPSNLRSEAMRASAIRMLACRSTTDAYVDTTPSSVSSVRSRKRCVSAVPGTNRKSEHPRRSDDVDSRYGCISTLSPDGSAVSGAHIMRLLHLFVSFTSSYASRECLRGRKNHFLCTSDQRPDSWIM